MAVCGRATAVSGIPHNFSLAPRRTYSTTSFLYPPANLRLWIECLWQREISSSHGISAVVQKVRFNRALLAFVKYWKDLAVEKIGVG